MARTKKATASLILPTHLTKDFTGKDSSDLEVEFVATIVSDYSHLISDLSRTDAPYRGTKYKTDYVLMLPPGANWKGICIELQGGIWQSGKTGHSTGKALERDYEKCRVSQLNGFYHAPFSCKQLNVACETLNEIWLAAKLYVEEGGTAFNEASAPVILKPLSPEVAQQPIKSLSRSPFS